MKNKGFTLIELLAVIVILAIIALIATPIILGIIANTRSEARVRSAEAVEHALETGYLTTYMKCAAEGSSIETCITVAKVIENTKVENEVKESRTTSSITTKDGVVCTLDSNYVLTCVYGGDNVITPKTVNGQSNSGSLVTTSPICEFTGYYVTGGEQTDKEEYTCHLDTDRIFLVLGDNAEDSTKVDLIMDRNYIDANVPETMAWCDPDGDNPQDNACNHDNLDQYITYIQTKFGNNVTVGLPTYDQIYAASGSENLDDVPWIYGNLSGDYTPYSYWTSTPSSSNSSDAWDVGYSGYLGYYYVDITDCDGIRPVITISKSLLSE